MRHEKPISEKFNHMQLFEHDLGAEAISRNSIDFFEKINAGLVSKSGKIVILNGIEVTQGAGLSVDISSGNALIPDEALNQKNTHYGAYDGGNIVLSAAHATLNRRDSILARFKKTPTNAESLKFIDSAHNLTQVLKETKYVYELEIYKKDGTPSASPVAPAKDLGYNAFILSSHDFATTPTIDFSTKYKIRIQIGGNHPREIDLRGAIPSATTLAEIVSAINTAFSDLGYNVADGTGDVLTLTDETKIGSESKIILTPPQLNFLAGNITVNIDATDSIFSGYYNEIPTVLKNHTNTNVYQIECVGLDETYKIAEVLVNATSTTPDGVYSHGVGTQFWTTDTGTEIITDNDTGFIEHKHDPILDHPDKSIYYQHFNSDAVDKLKSYLVTNEIAKIADNIDLVVLDLMKQKIITSYVIGKQYQNGNHFIELYFDKTNVENSNARILHKSDRNDSYSYHKATGIHKYGLLKPDRMQPQFYPTEKINLDGIGMVGKLKLVRDNVNKCYYLLTSRLLGGAYSQLYKLSSKLEDNRVEVLGYWTLHTVTASHFVSSIAIMNDGTNDHIIICYTHLVDDSIFGTFLIDHENNTIGGKGFGETLIIGASNSDNIAYEANQNTGWRWTDVVTYDSNDIAVIEINESSAPDTIRIRRFGKGYANGSHNAPTGSLLSSYVDKRIIQIDGTYDKFSVYTDEYVEKIFFSDSSTGLIRVANKVNGDYFDYHGEFYSTRINDVQYSKNGISLNLNGDIVQCINTSANGLFLQKYKYADAFISETQLTENNKSVINDKLTEYFPYGLEVSSDGTLYSFKDATTLVRRSPSGVIVDELTQTTSFTQVAKDLCRPETDTVTYWIQSDPTNTYIRLYFVNNSVIDALSHAGTFGITGNVNALLNNTDVFTGICHDTDSNILLLLNNTTKKIDTVELNVGASATYTAGVYALPDASGDYYGIAYKGDRIYVGNKDALIYDNKVIVLKKSKLTSTTSFIATQYRYRLHDYTSVDVTGLCIDKVTGDLWFNDTNDKNHRRMAVMGNDDCMTIRTFLDGTNKLQSSELRHMTKPQKRYFEPENYVNKAFVPHKIWSVVSYGETQKGFSLLGWNEFIAERTATGIEKYDPAEVTSYEFLTGSGKLIVNSVKGIKTAEDMIFVVDGSVILKMIDLKNDKVYQFWTNPAAFFSGLHADKSIYDRNATISFIGSANPEFDIGTVSSNILNIYTKTFFKEDASDYNEENPTTYCVILTEEGHRILEVKWNSDGSRTPTKVVYNTTTGIFGLPESATQQANERNKIEISDSGKIFTSAKATGQTYDVIKYTNSAIWDICNGYDPEVVETTHQISLEDIKIRNWKTVTGEWKHLLYIIDAFNLPAGGVGKTFEYDVEKDILTELVEGSSNGLPAFSLEVYDDDYFFAMANKNASADFVYLNIMHLKRNDFVENDVSTYLLSEKFSTYTKDTEAIDKNGSFYYFVNEISVSNIFGTGSVGDPTNLSVKIFYSDLLNCLFVFTGLKGCQLIHFNQLNSFTQTINKEIDCNNAETFYLTENNQKEEEAFTLFKVLPNNSLIKFVDGATSQWQNLGTVTEQQLEDAVEIEPGLYQFPSAYGSGLKKSDGSPLLDGTDFNFNGVISDADQGVDIYDDGISGALTKPIRILENNKNITDVTGLNLTVEADVINKMSSGSVATVDPYTGVFKLPSPIMHGRFTFYDYDEYQSKLNTEPVNSDLRIKKQVYLTDVINKDKGAVVKYYSPNFTGHYGSVWCEHDGSVPSAAYWSTFRNFFYRDSESNENTFCYSIWGCSQLFGTASDVSLFRIAVLNMDTTKQITINIKVKNSTIEYNVIEINPTTVVYSDSQASTELYIAGSKPVPTDFKHLFITYDGTDIKFYINNVLKSTFNYPGKKLQPYYSNTSSYVSNTSGSYGKTFIVNQKVWNEYNSGILAMEWNGGNINLDSLHPSYASASKEPTLVKCGYYYTPNPASNPYLLRDGVTEGLMRWVIKENSGFEAGIHTYRDSNAGGVYLTLEDVTLLTDQQALNGDAGTVIQPYDNYHIQLYAGIASLKEDLEPFINLYDPLKKYRITMVQDGVDYGFNNSFEFKQGYLDYLLENQSDTEYLITIYHSQISGYFEEFVLNKGTTDIYKIVTFKSDGITDTFVIDDVREINKADRLLQVGITSGGTTTWYEYYDPTFSWGSNSPNYDDETIDSNYHFGVKFLTAPNNGDVVQLKFLPKYNKFKVTQNIKIANDGTFVDHKSNIKNFDYIIEWR